MLWGALHSEEAAEVWEPWPGGYLPDMSDIGEPELLGSLLPLAFFIRPRGLWPLSVPLGERLHCERKHSEPRAAALSSNVLVPAGVLWPGLSGVTHLSLSIPAMCSTKPRLCVSQAECE